MTIKRLKIRRALFTVTDKTGILELAKKLEEQGTEIIATGNTGRTLEEGGIRVVPIERITGNPEAFQGRMKTISFPVCSGILYRRGKEKDELDLEKLKILPIDCVVVNFYPFEEAVAKGLSNEELVDQIDIGGPTLVRSAAKNSPDTLVLTHCSQYGEVIKELSEGGVTSATCKRNASYAWDLVSHYDNAISDKMGSHSKGSGSLGSMTLRYGENPHQSALLTVEDNSPIHWPKSKEESLTPNELSFNNIMDLSSAYQLTSGLVKWSNTSEGPDGSGVVIVKHGNPCGVAWVKGQGAQAQLDALERAWEGDPVSAFGGVLVFSDPIHLETAEVLKDRFIELVACPQLTRESESLGILMTKRKKLKAVAINRFDDSFKQEVRNIPGAKITQDVDMGWDSEWRSVTEAEFPRAKEQLIRFGTLVTTALKSNAVAFFRELNGVTWHLVGAGQGQPNRVEALRDLAIPRAQRTLERTTDKKKDKSKNKTGGSLADCILVSDAFFPFRDTVETAADSGCKFIVQPGGSIKDQESIDACNEKGLAKEFTGTRHFKH